MKRAYLAILLVSLLKANAVSASHGASPHDRVAFVDVNVIPMDRDRVIRHQTVLVSNGKIRRIGPTGSVQVPSGATVVRGSGKYLMPGLSDMHQHFLRSPEPGRKAKLVFDDADEYNRLFGLLAVMNGVTSVRSLWGQSAIDKITVRFLKDELIGPTVYSSGPITDGDPPEIPGARAVGTQAQGRAAVREDKRQGRDGVKIYDLLTLPNYDAILHEAHLQHIPVWGHLPYAISLDHAIAMGQKSIEHIDSLLGPMQSHPADVADKRLADLVREAKPERLRVLARKMRAAGVWVCPTIVVYQMDWADGKMAEGMSYMPEQLMKRYSANWPVEPTNALADLEFGLALKVVHLLHQEGVGILAGSDGLKRNVVPGFALIQELSYLVAAGMRPYAALKAATADPARFLGRGTEFGTVAPGMRADLLLLAANPLQDIGNLRKRVGVMLRGRWYSDSTLQQRLDRLRANLPETRGLR